MAYSVIQNYSLILHWMDWIGLHIMHSTICCCEVSACMMPREIPGTRESRSWDSSAPQIPCASQVALQRLVGIGRPDDLALSHHIKQPQPVCEVCHHYELHVRPVIEQPEPAHAHTLPSDQQACQKPRLGLRKLLLFIRALSKGTWENKRRGEMFSLQAS